MVGILTGHYDNKYGALLSDISTLRPHRHIICINIIIGAQGEYGKVECVAVCQTQSVGEYKFNYSKDAYHWCAWVEN